MLKQRAINTAGDDIAEEASNDATPVVVFAAENIRTPFLHSEFITADPVTNHDELTLAVSHAPEAARLCGEHFVRLLYGFTVDAHVSPYGIVPTRNSLDSRDWTPAHRRYS
jgi:hypothetical protein